MKQYIKNGKIKKKNQIIIHKNGKQIINPTESSLLKMVGRNMLFQKLMKLYLKRIINYLKSIEYMMILKVFI